MKRNDPCPCGSGRKYKRCCLGRAAREQHQWKQASDRDMILMAKAEGISVAELRRKHHDRKIKRSTAMFGVFAAMYGGGRV